MQVQTVDENGQAVAKGTKVSRGYYADNGPATTLSGTGACGCLQTCPGPHATAGAATHRQEAIDGAPHRPVAARERASWAAAPLVI